MFAVVQDDALNKSLARDGGKAVRPAEVAAGDGGGGFHFYADDFTRLVFEYEIHFVLVFVAVVVNRSARSRSRFSARLGRLSCGHDSRPTGNMATADWE